MLKKELEAGRDVPYDEDELNRIIRLNATARRVPLRAVWAVVLRFFFPGLLLIAVLWGLVFLLRLLR